MRYFMIDRITEWDPGKSASGRKCVSLSEDFFADHFPRHPILPGVLILESLAQLAGILLEESARARFNRSFKALLVMIEQTKFRRIVNPGETLDLHATIEALEKEYGRVATSASIDGERVAETTMAFGMAETNDEEFERIRRDLLNYYTRDLRSP